MYKTNNRIWFISTLIIFTNALDTHFCFAEGNSLNKFQRSKECFAYAFV